MAYENKSVFCSRMNSAKGNEIGKCTKCACAEKRADDNDEVTVFCSKKGIQVNSRFAVDYHECFTDSRVN